VYLKDTADRQRLSQVAGDAEAGIWRDRSAAARSTGPLRSTAATRRRYGGMNPARSIGDGQGNRPAALHRCDPAEMARHQG